MSVFRIRAISPARSASLWAQVHRISKIRNDSGRVTALAMPPQSAVRTLAPVPKLKFSAAKPPRYRPPPLCNGRRRFQASDWFTNISAAHAGLVHSSCNCKTEGQRRGLLQATRTKATSGTTRSARLFVLELNAGRIHSMNPDGSDKKTIVTNCRLPDGIAVDVEAGHIYWTNMGVPNLND